MYFSASDVVENRRGFAERLRKDHYSRPALRPVATGLGGKAPAPVQGTAAEPHGDGVKVTWRTSEDAASYAVYRADGERPGCGPVEPGQLIAGVRGGGIIDPTAEPGRTYTYYVTALDRRHHQSAPARGATVTVPKG